MFLKFKNLFKVIFFLLISSFLLIKFDNSSVHADSSNLIYIGTYSSTYLDGLSASFKMPGLFGKTYDWHPQILTDSKYAVYTDSTDDSGNLNNESSKLVIKLVTKPNVSINGTTTPAYLAIIGSMGSKNDGVQYYGEVGLGIVKNHSETQSSEEMLLARDQSIIKKKSISSMPNKLLYDDSKKIYTLNFPKGSIDLRNPETDLGIYIYGDSSTFSGGPYNLPLYHWFFWQPGTVPSPEFNPKKEQRNETANTDWTMKKVNASPGDLVDYRITINKDLPISNSAVLDDVLDSNLSYQKGSLKVEYPNEGTSTDDSQFIKNNKINLKATTGKVTISFKAVIKNEVSENSIITNTAGVTDPNLVGGDRMVSNTTKIGITKPKYVANFSKQLKNITQKDTDFKTNTSGQNGDEVDYQIKYAIDNTSETTLTSGQIKDQLPTGLKLDEKSIRVTYNDGTIATPASLDDINIKTLNKGDTVTVNFKTIITQKTAGVIKNTAAFSGTTSDHSATPETTSEADLNVTKPLPKPIITKQVVNLKKVPNPKNSDYEDSAIGLPGNQFRYHIRLDAVNGTTKNIIFKDNDLDETLNFDQNSDNYAIIHHGDGTTDEKAKLTADDFTSPNTIDLSKRFKSDQIGDGAYIDMYFTVNTINLVTPIGTVIPNTAHITNTADGDNNGKGWDSNTANINLYADPIMTKQVKLASDPETSYVDKLQVSPDSDLDYRVQIKPNKEVKTPKLTGIKVADPFNGKLNQGLTLNKVTANYYDANNKKIDNETETLTSDSNQMVSLSHPVVTGGHVDIVYQVHLDKNVPKDSVFHNIAYMNSSSYGNNADHKLPNWQTNDTEVNVIATGKVIFRYIDRESDMNNPTKIAKEVTVEGNIGQKVSDINNNRIRPKHINHWTVIDEALTNSEATNLTGATFYQAQKDNPTIAKETQVITYRYEKAMITMNADKSWDFGKYLNTQRNATYYLPAQKDTQGNEYGNGVNIEDYYGVDNWQLAVQQDGQFKSEMIDNHQYELNNAQLHFSNAQVKLIDGAKKGIDTTDSLSEFILAPTAQQPTSVISYTRGGHFDKSDDSKPNTDIDGTKYDSPDWRILRYQFGQDNQVNYSVGLQVPETTKRYKTHYQTTLTWTLNVAP